MPKTKNIWLRTADAELEFAVEVSTTGKQLFEQVAKTIGLREVWYFGISYTNSKGEKDWIKLNKKVIGGHDFGKQDPIEMELKIKFYPEEAEVELIQEITKTLFYLEIKQAILTEKIYCDAPTSVILASFACQVNYGDYNEAIKIQEENLLPQSTIQKYSLSKSDWAEKIAIPWKSCRDLLKEEAMMQYIKTAQSLDMFGVNYFEIKNRKGTELLLGVDADGMNIYEKVDRLDPRISFPWNEIKNIMYNDKKFVLKAIDKDAPDFIFYASNIRTNKRILSMCMGNHELFMRRRREPTLEIQQMMAQNQNEMEEKQREKKRQKSLRDEKEAIIEENRRLKAEMAEIRQKEKELEENLKKKEEEKAESERKAKELEILKAKQEEELKQLDEKRAELEKELKQQKEEFATKSTEESQRIDGELRAMRVERIEIQKQMEITVMEQKRQREQQQLEDTERKLRSLTPMTSIDEEVTTASVDMTNQEPNGVFQEISQDQRPKVAVYKYEEIKKLSDDLEQYKKEEEQSNNDRIVELRKQHGQDRYKTLRELRLGNTRRRVEQFENLR